MSDLVNTVEETWRTVHKIVAGANCVCARLSHDNNHLNLYVHRIDNSSKVEIPSTPLYNQNNNPQLVGVYV